MSLTMKTCSSQVNELRSDERLSLLVLWGPKYLLFVLKLLALYTNSTLTTK